MSDFDFDGDIDEEMRVVDLSEPMYNISNVKTFIKQTRNRRRVELVFEDKEDDFNLFKFYLALCRYKESMEAEIGIMEATDTEDH